MSMVTLDRKVNRSVSTSRRASATTTIPVAPVRVQTRQRAKTKQRVMQYVLSRAGIFMSFLIVGNFGATVVGNMVLQSKSNDVVHASRRYTEAQAAESRLQKDIESLTSSVTVQDWAMANGFVPPESPMVLASTTNPD